MSFKDLLVTVDGDSADQSPLALAAWLAERFEAHLVGLHPSSAARASLYSANFGTELFDDAMRETFRDPGTACAGREDQLGVGWVVGREEARLAGAMRALCSVADDLVAGTRNHHDLLFRAAA